MDSDSEETENKVMLKKSPPLQGPSEYEPSEYEP